MILGIVYSVNQVPIRLPEERWDHINLFHPDEFDYNDPQDVLDAIELPTYILRGTAGALMAVVPRGKRNFLHVMYRELNANDGFIITAYYKSGFDREKIIWRAEDEQ